MNSDSRLVYLFLYVRDMATTRSFYEDTLGLPVIEADDFCVKYDAGGVILALNPAGEFGLDPDRAVDRSSLVVFHTADLEHTRAELEARGIPLAPTERYDIGATATFRDPDGHTLCLYEPSEEALGWPSGAKVREILSESWGPEPPAPARVGPLTGARLLYLFLFVPDALAAREFYEKQLGLRAVEEDDSVGVVKYDGGGILLATHLVEGDPRTRTRAEDLAGRRSLSPVFHVDAIGEALVELAGRGLRPVSGPAKSRIGATALVCDPVGHSFYLYEASEEALTWPSGDKLRALRSR